MATKSPRPVVNIIMQKITTSTSGDLSPGYLPDIKSTAVKGIKPIQKLIALEIVAENAKISGRTYTLVKIPELDAIESAAAVSPWLKNVIIRTPDNK